MLSTLKPNLLAEHPVHTIQTLDNLDYLTRTVDNSHSPVYLLPHHLFHIGQLLSQETIYSCKPILGIQNYNPINDARVENYK